MEKFNRLTVQERLEIEAIRRAANGAFSQSLLLITMFFWTPPFSGSFIYRTACLLLIISCIVRWIIFHRLKSDPEKLAKTNPWNLRFAISTAVGWAVVNGMAIGYFHLQSFTGIIHLFTTIGLLAAVMYSLAPTPKLQRWYTALLGLPVCLIIYICETNENLRYASLLMLVFIFYLVMASKNHSADLKNTYELENRLLKENMKLQEIFDSIPGFMILLSQSGEWTLSSKSSHEVIHSENLLSEINSFLKSGLDRRTIELEMSTKEENAFVVSFEKLKTNEGTIVTGLPINELRKVRGELEVQRAKTEYSTRLAAVGEMAGGVAHEINNPLSVVSLTSEFLAKKLQEAGISEEIWKKYTDKIFSTSTQIARIVSSLQNLSRTDVLEESLSVDVDKIIQEIIDISREKMSRKGITLLYSSQGKKWVVGKHVDIGQVFLNLINNAYDAIPGEGKIQINVFNASEKIIVQFMDTGSGISSDIKDKLFQPFFSTKPVGQGTGLGLSVVRSTLLKYGGDIELLKEANPTIFQVTLKRA